MKMPLFLLHLWLPKAHVEAMVSGSMILAGVMLKLGGYGLMRVLVLFVGLGLKISSYFMSIALVGGVFVSLIGLRQSGIKSLIAYSSVAHMGLIVCGLFTFTIWGLAGSLAMMLPYSLCSGLFCFANMNYERLNSRSLFVNKGMINFLPSLSLWWFLLCSSNMAAPPSLNLLSEIMLLSSVVSWSSLTMFLVFFFFLFLELPILCFCILLLSTGNFIQGFFPSMWAMFVNLYYCYYIGFLLTWFF